MSKVFLLTGFNNWGKSYIIEELFNGRKRFYRHKVYPYGGYKFCVQSQSNDDLGQKGYESILKSRINKLSSVGITPTHIFTAFCPTKEPSNNSLEIIKNLYSNDEVHIIGIEYKWCMHAKLQMNELQNYYSSLKNVTVHTLSEKNIKNKKLFLDSILKPLL